MMNKINNEIYYHINTGKKLEVGNVLEIGKVFNNFYYEIYDTEHLVKGKDANQILMEMKKEHGVISDNNMDELILKTINDDAMITRELMFEETRKEVNSELPSRLKCLYVCKTKKEIKEWLDIFQRTSKKHFQILKLKLTGTIFCGDASFILRQNISLHKKKEQAKMYWSGSKKNNINEYLFIGKAIVEDILNEKDF